MGKNIKSQFLYCITSNFKEGMSKHSLKSQDSYKKQTKIFSYSDRKNLIDTASHFSNWLKDKYPEIRMVRDLKSNHLQQYLNENSNNWTRDTIGVKISYFKKLETLSNQTFKGSQVSFNSDIVKPSGQDRARSIAMTRVDYNKLMEIVSSSRSQAVRALELCGRFGLRVSEVSKLQCRDIKSNNNFVSLNIVDSKGKRSRELILVDKEKFKRMNLEKGQAFVLVSKQDISYLKSLTEGLKPDARLVNIQSKSINRFVCRSLEKSGLKQYIERRTSLHSIRKMVAQEQYNIFRDKGLSRQDTLDRVSFFLGHGKNRNECIERYVLNTW